MADMNSARGQYSKVDVNVNHSDQIVKHSSKEYGPSSSKSWHAPVTMLSALVIGLGIAIAHHVTNTHLDGREVTSISLSQAWVSRFATALAFLVKLFFTITVGIAFVQYQWLNFHQRSLRIKDIDALTSILDNLFFLFSSSIWWQLPVLTVIGIVSWLIPLAAVITPGTLQVAPAQRIDHQMVQVPQLMWNGTNFGTLQSGGGGSLIDASGRTQRIAFSTATSAKPVTLPSQFQNETYHLDFYGPTVKCDVANETIIRNLSVTFWSGYSGNSVSFVSWVGGDESAYYTSKTKSLPVYFNTLDQDSLDASKLYVMTNMGWSNYSLARLEGTNATRVNVTECRLYNASYSVDFDFHNREQSIKPTIKEYLNPVVVPSYGAFLVGPGNETAQAYWSYSAMMDAYGKLLVGYASSSHYGISSTIFTSYSMLSIDWRRQERVISGLEQLFQNFTLSMLSESTYTKNATQADFVNVTVTNYPIIYVYEPFALWLSYGLGFACALICAVIGMYAFHVNQGSYQNVFSTFIRTTNDPALQSVVDNFDKGFDPLPKEIGSLKISMGSADQSGS